LIRREELAMPVRSLVFAALLLSTWSCSRQTNTVSQPATDTRASHSSAATTQAAPPTDFRSQFIAAAKAIGPAVASITSLSMVNVGSALEGTPFEFFFHGDSEPRGKTLRRGIGSGVVIDAAGFVLTNNHVVEGADKVKVVLADNRELSAKVVGTDPKSDVAVVKLTAPGEQLHAALLGNSDKLEVGEWVVAAGSPFGLRQTVSAGIISAIGRGNVGISEYEDFIQTDAAINPGNSGGPLVDLEGRVVGINTAIASRNGGNNGVGFAIPIAMAKNVADQLIATGKVVRGYVGLYIGDVTEALARSFGYQGVGGALVQDVTPGGPGARAGIGPGDIIFERDGRPVLNAASVRNGVAESPPGTETTFKIWRDGKALDKRVKLGELPGAEPAIASAAPAKEGHARWGLQLLDPTPALRSRLQLGSAPGALVASVKPESPADDAGLRSGDLITQVGNHPVHSAVEAQKALLAGSSPTRLRVSREGHGLFIVLTESGS
jgi:serine protease Do